MDSCFDIGDYLSISDISNKEIFLSKYVTKINEHFLRTVPFKTGIVKSNRQCESMCFPCREHVIREILIRKPKNYNDLVKFIGETNANIFVLHVGLLLNSQFNKN